MEVSKSYNMFLSNTQNNKQQNQKNNQVLNFLLYAFTSRMR